jgi:hypothetical protein
MCWRPCSSCWSFHLLREEFLSAPIHSPPSLVRRIGPSVPDVQTFRKSYLPHPDSDFDVLHMNLDLVDEYYPIVMSKLPFEEFYQGGQIGFGAV